MSVISLLEAGMDELDTIMKLFDKKHMLRQRKQGKSVTAAGSNPNTIIIDDVIQDITTQVHSHGQWCGYIYINKLPEIIYPGEFFDKTSEVHQIIKTMYPRIRMRSDRHSPIIELKRKSMKFEEMQALIDTLHTLLTPYQ